jgi:hypothetical protein
VSRPPRRLRGPLAWLGGVGAALGLGGIGGAVQRSLNGGDGFTEVAIVVAAGIVAVLLVGTIALIVALFCKREAPSRRLRQLIEALHDPGSPRIDLEKPPPRRRRSPGEHAQGGGTRSVADQLPGRRPGR